MMFGRQIKLTSENQITKISFKNNHEKNVQYFSEASAILKSGRHIVLFRMANVLYLFNYVWTIYVPSLMLASPTDIFFHIYRLNLLG